MAPLTKKPKRGKARVQGAEEIKGKIRDEASRDGSLKGKAGGRTEKNGPQSNRLQNSPERETEIKKTKKRKGGTIHGSSRRLGPRKEEVTRRHC